MLVQIKTVWFKQNTCRWLVCNLSSERCNTGSVFNFEAIVTSNLGGVLVISKLQNDGVWIFRVSKSKDLCYHLWEFGPTQLAENIREDYKVCQGLTCWERLRVRVLKNSVFAECRLHWFEKSGVGYSIWFFFFNLQESAQILSIHLMSFDNCEHPYNHHCKQDVECFHHSGKSSCVLVHPVFSCPRGNHCSNFHYHRLSLQVLGLHRNALKQYIFLFFPLAFFTQHNVLEIGPCCVYQ